MADDGGGLDAFCRVEHPRLVAALTVYTGNRDLVAELAQEALARAHRDWSTVRDMASPGGWAHRVAVNLANSSLRRRRLERAARARAAVRVTDHWDDPLPPATGVLQPAARLPRRQREALALRFLLDLSVEDTATRMGCAAGTVRALTAQGVAALRALPELRRVEEPTDG